MNVVEAIDLWIDANIDDFSDDDLDEVLIVLDEIAAHELAEFDTRHLRPEEFDELVEQFEAPAQRLLADEMITGGLQTAGRLPDDYRIVPDDTAQASVSDEDGHQEADSDNSDESAAGNETQPNVVDIAPSSSQTAAPISDEDLAPRFLGSSPVEASVAPSHQESRTTRLVIGLTLAAALTAFALGAWSLFSSLDDPVSEIVETIPTATAQPSADPVESAAATGTNDNGADEVAESEPTAEPEPEPTVEPTPTPTLEPATTSGTLTAYVLDDQGDVYASVLTDASSDTSALIYDSDDAASQPVATSLLRWNGKLAILTEVGDVRLAAADTPDITVLWDTNNFAPATDAAYVDGNNVILTNEGTIVSFVGDESPNIDVPELVWEEPRANGLATNGTALAAVLDKGDIWVWPTLDDEPLRVWAAEGQPIATGVDVTSSTVIIALDGGRLVSIKLDELDGETEPLWQGSAEQQPWALAFSGSDDRAAIVLDSYQVVVLDDDSQLVAWDGADGLPAPVDVAFVGDELVVLLDTGSVVQVSTSEEATERSIWDVSEETIAPARQPLLVASE